MSEQRSRKILGVALVWLLVLGGVGALYKFIIAPGRRAERLRQTGTPSRFHTTVRIAHDSFSGYAVLRSNAMRERLADDGLLLEFRDDGADYGARIRALRDGQVDMAVFTIDALIKASAAIGEFPGTIVLMIDETRGADAVVSYKQGLSDLAALDSPGVTVIATADSPSETLARVLYDQFRVDAPLANWLGYASSVEDVYGRLRQANPTARRAFVLWEPYVTKALEDDAVHVLLDTSSLRGFIVDVLVVSREFLQDSEVGVTRAVVEAYLRTAFELKLAGEMVDAVQEDAREHGEALSAKQAERLVAGIHWKNTLENYAHFGILAETPDQELGYLEDIIRNIKRVLLNTGALQTDPLEGRDSFLFYDAILRSLHEANFHPGSEGTGGSGDLTTVETIQVERALVSLSDAQWEALVPVGLLRVEPIRFGRGTARLNVSSKRTLAGIAEQLAAWPQAYLDVIGHARSEGDPTANERLADERAQAAASELERLGVAPARLRSIVRDPDAQGGAAQSVSFRLGQLPY